MSSRKLLPGLLVVIALAGAVAAAPPIDPLVQGREPNPVVREYLVPETPVGGYVAPGGAVELSASAGWLAMPAAVCDWAFSSMSFPLGAALMTEVAEATGV